MSYLNVITLEAAKNYLRVDDTLTEDDARITSMIKASLSMLEKSTNILVYARSKEYFFEDYCVYVYDYPINTLISPTDADVIEKQSYSIYSTTSSDDKKLTLNVGYTDANDVNPELIEVALYMLKYMYYEAETDKVSVSNFPQWIQVMISQLKRFII
jgi:hypothetical protein